MSLRACRRFALLACLTLMLARLDRAHADADAGKALDYIRLSYATSDGEASALEQTLRLSLQLPNLECEFRRVANIDPRALLQPEHESRVPLARIWVDLTRAERAAVFVIDGDYAHVYVRSLARAASPALDHAEVGEIVRSAVQALQDGAVIGIARPAQQTTVAHERASSSTANPDARGGETRFGGGLLYGIGLRARDGELAQGPGLYGYGLRQLHELGLGALLTAQYQPIRIAGANARASLDTLALRAGPLLETAPAARWSMLAVLAIGTDLVQITPSTGNSSVIADKARLAAFPLLEIMLGLRARVSAHVELLANAALDVELVDTRYVLQSAARVTVVEDPFPIRPSIQLGLGFF